jgi:hypothetical protein
VPVTKGFEDRFRKEKEFLTWRRSLVGVPGSEKMGVVSWHI